MDECENVLNVETYAAIAATKKVELYEIEQKINDNDDAFMQVIDTYNDEEEEEEDAENMGQAESKRNAKKHGTVGGGGVGVCVVTGAGTLETKGTAMSFGFRKKLNTTPKKLKKLIEGDAGKKKQQQMQQMDGKSYNINHNEIVAKNKITNTQTQTQAEDSNGNMEPQISTINFKKVSAAAAVRAASSPANTEHHYHEYQPREATRFGFRGVNAPRPASTGLTSRENIENNNCLLDRPSPGGLVSNCK